MSEQAGQDWTGREVDAVLDLYLDLLDADLVGRRVVKARAYRELAEHELPARSPKAVEYKLQNISAVMIDLGLPRVAGLAPARNIQGSLTDAVRTRLLADATTETLDRLVAVAAERAATYAAGPNDRIVPPPDSSTRPPAPLRDVRPFDWDDAERRRLGLLGEQWVVAHERRRLDDAGLPQLARDVTHVSVEHGDGAGYDIRSFDEDGSDRLIEVKTTASTIGRAFYVSKNEVEVSRQQTDTYWLYRLFDFYSEPRMYQLRGALDLNFELAAVTYAARPRSRTDAAT